MGTAISDLFSSKKFLMMIIGLIVWFAGKYGLDLDPSALYPPLALVASLIFSQGITDHGKEAAKINLEAAQVNAAAAPSSPPAPVAVAAVVEKVAP